MVVLTAGTSDLPVAQEAVVTATALGCDVKLLADVGVAGIHRLLRHREQFAGADAIVVVAGMDGALPSVVGGLVDCPVIAVPTSIGYGAAFHGLAPLLTMLNACSANVVVVNIDSGFKGGYVAALIARRARRSSGPLIGAFGRIPQEITEQTENSLPVDCRVEGRRAEACSMSAARLAAPTVG